MKVLRYLWLAGCICVNLGIEKGYLRGLNYLNKQITISNILKSVQLLRKAGNFIINGILKSIRIKIGDIISIEN